MDNLYMINYKNIKCVELDEDNLDIIVHLNKNTVEKLHFVSSDEIISSFNSAINFLSNHHYVLINKTTLINMDKVGVLSPTKLNNYYIFKVIFNDGEVMKDMTTEEGLEAVRNAIKSIYD